MKDLNLVDIEKKIYKDLSSYCDIDQEAQDYIENSLEDITSFGLKEKEDIISSREKALSGIKSYLLVSLIPLIKKIIDLFSNTNLYSLKKTYLSTVFFFLSPLKQHNKILAETEEIFAELLEKEKNYRAILELFANIQREQIEMLERIDKKILLGKSVHHQLAENFKDNQENLSKLQGRILQMEITKNIPLQIITKIQSAEEIVSAILNSINKNLAPDFALYINNYREILLAVKQKKERDNLKTLVSLYQNILRDIRKLEILDEDLEEKFQDLKDSLPLLLK